MHHAVPCGILMKFNPFPDKQLTLLGTVPKPVCHFRSLSIFCLGCKTISRRAACRLIVLHPKQNIESELEWQTCSGTMPSKFSCSSVKGHPKNKGRVYFSYHLHNAISMCQILHW